MERRLCRCSEPLECRRLFAGVFLTPAVMHVWGAPLVPNTIVVGLTPDQLSVTATLTAQLAGGPLVTTRTFGPARRIRLLDIRGGFAADSITIDQTNGSFPIPARIFAGNGSNVVIAGDELDVIGGRKDADFINGGNGRSIIVGGFGADTLIGGNGPDLINAGPGSDSISGGGGNDRIGGGTGADTIDAGDGNDLVAGNAGLDSINAGEGNDTLIDGRSKDTLFSGNGVDTFFVLKLKANPINDFAVGTDRLRFIVPVSNGENSFFDDLLDNFFFPF